MLAKISSDRLIGLLILFCSITIYFLLPVFIRVSNNSATSSFGPDFFPKVVLITLMILSLSLVVKSFIPITKNEDELSEEDEMGLEGMDKRKWAGWAVFGILIVYSFVVEYLGFVITSIVFMSVILYILSAKKWYYYLILIGMVFLINFVFVDLMRIMLP